jgi:acyl carrier protein
VGQPPDATVSIREMIVGLWPGRFTSGDLPDDVDLGEEGLGLDSVEVVELIFACENRWGKRASQGLFTDPPLTIKLLAHEFSDG